MLVGRIDEQRVPGPAASDHVDVVVHRSHHYLVDFGAPHRSRSSPAVPCLQRVTDGPSGRTGPGSGRQRPGGDPQTQEREPRMNFAFSDEQEELRTAVRRFLAEKSPETEVRRLMETTDGYDPAVWRQMADQLGLQSLTIPEEFGGSGFSYVELVVVLEEMGAALLCAPFFSTVALAANAVLTSGDDEAKKYLLPGIASGETIGTLAITEDNGRWDFGAIECRAEPSGGRLGPQRAQELRARRACGRPDRRGGAHGAGHLALRGQGGRRRADPDAAGHHGPDAQAGPAGVRGHPRLVDRHRWRGTSRTLEDPRPGGGGAGGRAGGRGPARARLLRRVRQDPDPVRSSHRQLPGDQAQVRRHAARGRVGQVGGLLRAPGPRPRTPTSFPWSPACASPTAPRRTSMPRRRTSRSTAASASPGSTRPTCTSSGPSPPSCLLGDPAYHRELLAQRIGI